MTRLFIRFYLGVLIVLLLAWYIHSTVLKRGGAAETARVIVAAHGGGARLMASALDAVPAANRAQVLQSQRAYCDYPIAVIAVSQLPAALQRQFAHGDDVGYFRSAQGHFVAAVLGSGAEVLRLGPFPDYKLREVEESIGGWMRITAAQLDATSPGQRHARLEKLQAQFAFPVVLARRDDLPKGPKERMRGGADVVFYSQGAPANDRWLAATPLADGARVIRFGPFPNFARIDQKAATTTLAVVLLPVALAIALLLRPVARQLRRVEDAAKAIAAGDLTARVDQRKVRSAAPLAHAFNEMASRTETLVRTQRELLQAVSHELRTPLSRMRFAIDLIETAKDDAQRKQRLASLDAATEELDQLVGELLRYVRMETAEPQLTRESIAVRETLDVLIPEFVDLYPSIDFRVSDAVATGAATVSADRLGLQRVLGNLLSNAGRFADSKVVIDVAVIDATTTIDVDDDGCGIDAAERRRVFEPFVRLDHHRNGSGHGVGLGLALVQRIMRQHGGSVHVLTSPLGGCRMRTTWPATADGPAGNAVNHS